MRHVRVRSSVRVDMLWQVRSRRFRKKKRCKYTEKRERATNKALDRSYVHSFSHTRHTLRVIIISDRSYAYLNTSSSLFVDLFDQSCDFSRKFKNRNRVVKTRKETTLFKSLKMTSVRTRKHKHALLLLESDK